MNISPAKNHLTLGEKVGYALGDTASNLFWMTFMFYLLYFYTDVFGLSAAAAGTMLLITRIWDTVNSPIIGLIADRTETRWGKFRPYIIWGAIPFGVFGVLTFTTPNLGPAGKLIYAYVTFTLMMTIYTVVNLPYSALLGVITPNSEERTILSTYRFIFAFIGAITVQYLTLPLVGLFGHGNRAHGYQITMAVFSTLAVILLLITFFNTRERVHPPHGQRNSIRADLQDLAHNRPWLILFVVSFLTVGNFSVRSATTLYYFKYYVGDAHKAPGFMVGGSIFLMLGIFCTHWLNRRFKRAPLYAGLLIIDAIVTSCFYLAGPHDWVLMYGLNFLATLFIGPTTVMIWAMYADTADYSQWRTGRRATGLIFSAAMFAQKVGGALGSAATGWVLAYYGFKANVTQSPHTLQGIRLLMSLYPSAFAVLASMIVLWYPLDREYMRHIGHELEQQNTGGLQPETDN